MDAELRNPYAEKDRPDSGVLVTAEEVRYGGNLFCPHSDCLDPERRLFTKRSKNGRYFFSHYGDYEHPINFETLLHKLAIRYFKDLDEFELPSLNGTLSSIRINSGDTILEYNGLRNIKPDVRLFTDSGKEYFIEIFVTHETKGKKLAVIGEYNIPTVEIDLSQFYHSNFERCKTDLSFVKSNLPRLISDIRLKKWLFNAEIVPVEIEVPKAKIEEPPSVSISKSADKSSRDIPWGWIGVAAVIFIPPLRNAFLGVIKSLFKRRGRS